MHETFQAAIRRLFEELRIAAPRFSEPNRIRLNVENVGLDLFDSGLGTIVIEAAAGRLSSDPQERARQTRRILDTNLGFLLGSEATVYLKRAAAGDTSLTARASHPLAGLTTDVLTKKVEDVIRAVEYYAPELITATRSSTPQRAPSKETFESAMIFRP